MRSLRPLSRLFLLVIATTGLPARAQPGGDAPPRSDLASLSRDPGFQERLRKWRAMTAEEREHIRARCEGWRKLSSTDRDQLVGNLARFKNLAPDRQASLARRFHDLPPEQRERLHNLASHARGFARSHQIPLGLFAEWLRGSAREEIQRIRQAPPEERKEAVRALVHKFYEFALARVESQLPEDERASFGALSFEAKLARARRWFAERRLKEYQNRAPGAPDGWRHRPDGHDRPFH